MVFCVRVNSGTTRVTHDAARKAVIIRSMSVSLRVVSPNPGVSIKATRRPSRLKVSTVCTVFVQDRSPLLTPRLDPLTRLMNCVSRRDEL